MKFRSSNWSFMTQNFAQRNGLLKVCNRYSADMHSNNHRIDKKRNLSNNNDNAMMLTITSLASDKEMSRDLAHK